MSIVRYNVACPCFFFTRVLLIFVHRLVLVLVAILVACIILRLSQKRLPAFLKKYLTVFEVDVQMRIIILPLNVFTLFIIRIL